MMNSPEAPNVPLTIQSNERLTFFQLSATARAVVRIDIFWARRLLQDFVVLLLCGSFGRTRLLLRYSFLDEATADTFLAKNFLSGVCDLLENRLC